MTDIKTSVLTVDTGGAITNIKELKEQIEDLKGKLSGLQKGTEDYSRVSKQLIENQEKLKNEMKDLDTSTGNLKNNVEEYSNSYSGAFDKLKTGVTSTVPSVNKLNTAFKALALNPIGAVITALALALAAVVKAMKGSEEQLNRFKVATAGVKVVVDGFKNALSRVADVFVTLTEKTNEFTVKVLTKLKSGLESIGWNKMANNIGNVLDKMEEYTELETKSLDLTKKRRDLNVAIAKTQNQVAELRAKIADKEKYSEEERLKFVEEWEAAEKHRSELAVAYAQEEYNIIKQKNALTESNTADLDAENDAYVRLINAQGEYQSSLMTINKQKTKLIAEVRKINDADEAQVENILKRLDERNKTELDKLEDKYKQEKILLEAAGKDTNALTEEYESARTKIIEENAQKELDIRIKNAKEAASKSIEEFNREYSEKITKLNLSKQLEETLSKNNKEFRGFQAFLASFNNLDDIFTTDSINSQLQKVIDYNNEVFRLTKEKNKQIIEQNQLLLKSLPEGSQESLDALNAISQAKIEIDNAETENHIANLEAVNDAEEKQQELREFRLGVYQQGLVSISSLLNNFASLQEQQIKKEVEEGKISEQQAKKRFEDIKKLQIGSAIMNTAAGAIGAFAQAAATYPAPLGQILGGIAAAAVVAAGAVQINSIKSQQFGSTSSTPTTPNLNQVVNEFTPEYTQNITSESELSQLTNAINSKPIYVSVTDIEDVQNKVKVRDEEITY